MGIITSGKIGVRPLHLSTTKTLEDIQAAAVALSYPRNASQASDGWGSSADDDSVINQPAIARLTVGEAEVVAADDRLPRRLRLRYYWDQLNRAAVKSIGDSADWRALHVRKAVDIVIFDGERQGGFSALLSSRDHRLVTATPLPAIKALLRSIDDKSSVSIDIYTPELPADFFAWLLYRLQVGGDITTDIHLTSIEEISSKDGSFRGARFTDKATLERIEVAALITMGRMTFGPAKILLSVEPLEAAFALELNEDGGFSVYRSSEYENREVSEDLLGHALVEDLWSVVLPSVRETYQKDKSWESSGRTEMRDLAVNAIKQILPPE